MVICIKHTHTHTPARKATCSELGSLRRSSSSYLSRGSITKTRTRKPPGSVLPTTPPAAARLLSRLGARGRAEHARTSPRLLCQSGDLRSPAPPFPRDLLLQGKVSDDTATSGVPAAERGAPGRGVPSGSSSSPGSDVALAVSILPNGAREAGTAREPRPHAPAQGEHFFPEAGPARRNFNINIFA